MTRKVTVIPQTIRPFTGMPISGTSRKKVAAYARVSTESEEQQTSYEAQVDYYTKYIKSKADWDFVKVYADEGITGTNTKQRNEFNEMIEDALNGKIDLIITKSVSRFARNTIDSLVTVRKLKDKGVEVYFEKENIYTLDSKGELLITIMSSLAQEESRSLSENVTWGMRKSFSDGKVHLPYKHFLGYEKGDDGLPSVVEREAAVVRKIYKMFMSGKTPGGIANALTKEGVPTPGNKEKWRSDTVLSILTNEKYKGAALLQKSFTVDFLTKKIKVNEGEVPQYYIENSHEAIIEPTEFEWVQAEIARRKKLGKHYSGNCIFSTKIICADCGSFYGSKVWQSNSKYRKTIWQCNGKYKDGHPCKTPHVTEDEIKERFVTAYNKLAYNRETVLADCRLMKDAVSDCTDIDEKLNELYTEADVVTGLIKKMIEQNSRESLDQQEYLNRYNRYAKRYDNLKAQIIEYESEKNARKEKGVLISGFMFEVSEFGTAITDFNDQLWMMTVDNVKIYSDGKIIFKFCNGAEIEG